MTDRGMQDRTRPAAEAQAVTDVMESVGAGILLQLDRDERDRLARTALRMYRRGFRDPAKLRIICRKTVLSWSG